MLIGGYGHPLRLLREEMAQCEYEGAVVPASLRERLAMLHPVMDAWNEAAIAPLLAELERLPRSPELLREEPNDLTAIRALRPASRYTGAVPDFTDDFLLDRFHGAWTGRAAGCALGKPVESMGMGGMGGNFWRDIRTYLTNRQAWPLTDYFPLTDAGDRMTLICPASCRENIAFMESDDDIRYTLIGLLILERYGRDFTWEQVAELWNMELSMAMTCTAEHQALLNYNMNISLTEKTFNRVSKEFTRRFNNPYREWIGAQIRADFFGFAAAGDPESAAEFAWRDASWTHTANGIYGAMFIAAVEAAAFVESDPARLVEIGLGEIPARCRLALAIREAVEAIGTCPDLERFMEWFEVRFQGMSPVHTVNNAVLCVAALFYGGMKLDAGICAAVMGGLDTDCNGATVGAIAGIAAGMRKLDSRLAGRLHDTIRAEFSEFRAVTMTELARRTLAVYRKIHAGTGYGNGASCSPAS